MTEVGVSLALRKQNKLFQSEKPLRRKEKAHPSNKSKKRTRVDRKQPNNSSWQIFVEGLALYTFCLVLPSLVGLVLHWCRRNVILNGIAMQTCSLPWISTFQWCIRNFADIGSNSANSATSLTDALAPDAGISDVGVVVLLSLSMAVVRLTLVHFLVPEYNQPKRLRALVRCKSIHLLSSAYPGTVTPRSSVKMKNLSSGDLDKLGIADLSDDDDNNFHLEKSIEKARSLAETKAALSAISGTIQPLDDHDHDHPDEKMWKSKSEEINPEWFIDFDSDDGEAKEDDKDILSAPAVSSGLMTSSSAHSLQALLQQATPMPEAKRSTISNEDAVRLFAAPKYATAVFRLLFSSVSCMVALVYFRDAEFWPPAVGGSGSTKNIWDLSSVGPAVMESDFDRRNTVLRHYFLFQLSYHFHSGAFHILAATLLWFVSAKNKEEPEPSPKTLGILPSGLMTIDNVQSLFQHFFAVGLIAGTYLFSSLRRLAAIAMFAFDVSSLFLHLLQLIINSPHGSRRIPPTWIRVLHRGLVVPAFCYSRFYVFPFVIAYSAFEESQDWLRQLENMWFVGTAKHIHTLLMVSFSLLMVMNFVYVRRLIFHPHVRDTLKHKVPKPEE
jgi:hypothetical protein